MTRPGESASFGGREPLDTHASCQVRCRVRARSLPPRRCRPASRQTGIICGVTTGVEVVAATLDDKAAIRHLLELYAHDFSVFTGAEVDESGRFGYRHLDQYWTDAERHPFLIRGDGRLSGFAFVRSGTPHDMAEFFILRKHRRSGVGVEAARAVFAMFPGEWQVRELAANVGAIAFWRVAIPVPFTEHSNDEGPVQRFRIPARER
jgi:predicted acetyltransferase